MVVRPLFTLALLAAAVLSGCLDDASGPGGGAALDAVPSGSPPTGEDAGTPASHGNHDRAESDITVSRNSNGEYIAKKTLTFSNDFGGASNADVKLKTQVGGVEARAGGNGGYEIVATLQGRGTTEQAARDNLARLSVLHSDSLGANRLTLSTEVRFPTNSQGLSGSLVATLPASPAYRLTGTTDTGGAAVSGLGGSSLTLEADTGGIDAAGAFNTANLQTDTGGIRVNGVFNVLTALTDTGGINARVRPTESGSIELDCDTGGIQLLLDADGGQGYDVEAEADTGGVDISLGATDDVGTQSASHQHVRTVGYDEAAIQTMVTASAGTGGVNVGRF